MGRNFIHQVNRLAESACVILFVLDLVVLAVQVLFRYVLRSALPWTEELARSLLVGVTFWGAAVAVFRNSHVRFEFLLRRIPPAISMAIQVIGDLLCLVYLILVAQGALAMVGPTWYTYAGTMPWMRKAYLYIVLLLGVVLGMFNLGWTILRGNYLAKNTQ